MDAKTVHCPICGKEVPRDHPEMPFCSERCRVRDLANWATDKYSIPAPITEDDEAGLYQQGEDQ